MATLDETIRIIINAEDRASATLKGVGDGISSISDGIGNVTGPLAGFADKLLTIDAAAAAAAAALISISGQAAQDFEAAFRNIATLVEEPVENLDSLRQGILDYAAGSTQGLDQIVKATYDAISAGTDWKEAIDQVGVSEKLAAGNTAELADANRILLQVTTAYADTNVTAAEAADKLTTAVRTGVTTFPELSASIGGVVDIAAKGGVSINELFAAVSTLTKTQDTATAVTALKGVITGIIAPSEGAKKAAEDLGIEFSAQNLKAKGLAGILEEVRVKTGGSADKMTELFGNVRGLSGVLGLATSEGALFKSNLDAQAQSAGAYITAFEKVAPTLDTGVDAVKLALIAFGTPFEQAFYNAKGALTDFANAFATASDVGAFSEIQDLVRAALENVADQFREAAKNLPAALNGVDWSGFIGAFGVLGESLSGVFGDLDLTSVEGLTSALQAIVDTGKVLITVTSGMVDGLKPFIQGAAAALKEVNGSDEATQKWAGEILGLAKGINTVLPAVSALGDGISALGTGLGALGAASALKTITGLGAGATTSAAALGSAAAKTGLVGAAGAAGYAVGTVLAGGIDSALSAITGSQTSLGSWIYDVTHASKDLSTTAPAAATALRDTGSAADSAADGYKSVVTPIEELATKQHDLITASDLMGNALLEGIIKTDKMAESAGALVTVYDSNGDAIEKTKLATGQLVNVLRDADGNITGYSQAVGATAGKLDKVGEATKKAKDETDAYRIKIAEIDAQLQAATLEAFVSIKTTQLETDAERVKATFASIDTTISSTGDLLGSLFDSLSNAGSLRDKFAIEDQIDLENKRRQEALDLQKELATAEIERVKAQTESLARGDSLIQIDGSGLEPQLEAFMWEILKAIRVRANAEFSDYLLGMSVA